MGDLLGVIGSTREQWVTLLGVIGSTWELWVTLLGVIGSTWEQWVTLLGVIGSTCIVTKQKNLLKMTLLMYRII